MLCGGYTIQFAGSINVPYSGVQLGHLELRSLGLHPSKVLTDAGSINVPYSGVQLGHLELRSLGLHPSKVLTDA
ncbi:unnamed protein product [Leptidea sinapis]|uniref:Uncharacterized protein n=1 Tax=Leptidea sinapis TaxID=189913 RepID=A0A5E4QQA0_9NEOP|nr:unnamed protein product [Leptidea sinapis]